MIIALLLLIAPAILQYKIGNMAIRSGKAIFTAVCGFSFILQFALTFIAFELATADILQSGNKCATAAVGIFTIGFLLAFIIIIVIAVQIANRNYRNKFSLK